ncbi:MAG TPA: glycosyltransferase family 39 protein [Terriglobia bacterium]|nr:glycosyltransferase family 39 protein [Terriglobia bacterium]
MRGAFWLVSIGLFLITRVPAGARYLSIDDVNLAFSLEHFDPLNHQPQPPGYPFFVALARIVNFLFRDPTTTFAVIALLTGALCLPVIVALGERIHSRAAGQAAALLLIVNPVFWQSGLVGPLRGFLALFSLLTAYCAWRAWKGETQWALFGACALGIGGGFRPDLLPALFPLWLVSAAAGSRSLKTVLAGTAIIGALTLVWVSALVIAVGSIESLVGLNTQYLARESERAGSFLFGASAGGVRRQVGRLVIWNALAVIGWIWAAPLALISRSGGADGQKRPSRLIFAAVWLLPGLLLQAMIHVEAPDHTLFSIPAFCLLGGWALSLLPAGPSATERQSLSGIALGAAMAINVMLFLNFIPLPTGESAPGALQSLKNGAAYGVFEASLGQVNWLDDINTTTMQELKQVTPGPERRWIIVSADDADRKEWFMNWRILRYYAPKADIWVATDQHQALRVLRDRIVESREAGEQGLVDIPAPRGGRIIWLIENGGALYRALQGERRLEGGPRLPYTDIPENGEPFSAWKYRFVPTSD